MDVYTGRLFDFEIKNEKLEQIKKAKTALKAKLGRSIESIAEEERISAKEVVRILTEDFGFVVRDEKAFYPRSEEEFDEKLMELIG